MNANDLRTGNLVSANGRWVKVESIHEKGINVYSHLKYTNNVSIEAFYGYVDLDPIPLSPEVLEACGFKQDWPHDKYSKGPFSYFTPEKDDFAEWLRPVVHFGSYQLMHVEYLHQLQNAWQILTGSELTVNLTQKV